VIYINSPFSRPDNLIGAAQLLASKGLICHYSGVYSLRLDIVLRLSQRQPVTRSASEEVR
jgi:hypothetical protein